MNEDEVICPCIGTTVRDIMDAVEHGANTVEDIQAITTAGPVGGD